MPHSKFIKTMLPVPSGLLKCTCGQTTTYGTERGEAMKLRMHLKVCKDPLAGWQDSWHSRKCRTMEENYRYESERYRKLHS